MPPPLASIKVLDLSRVLSGPFATQQLVDLGATVIKVEHPESGDDTRGFGPPFIGGESTYFMSVNRGKKSVAIDLKHPDGARLVRDLTRRADVVIENFRPGAAERLGLGMEALRRESPRLVTCSISGYGADGTPEFAGRAGYDAVIQAGSGLMSVTGAVDGPPSRVGLAIADLVSGLFAAQGILAALLARAETGEGRHVDVSMQEAMATLLTYQAAIYFATGVSPQRMGDAHPSICPYESFQTKDGLFMLAVGNDAQFVRFAERIGRPELATDPRFSTNRARVEHRPALLAEIAPKLAERTGAEWERWLAAEGIPGGPVLSIAQALEHPQLHARGAILTHAHPTAGAIRSVASPIHLAGDPRAQLTPPPRLGEHTREILAGELGLSLEAITDLAKRKAIVALDLGDPG
ncbi:MAG: CoA transferase [Deltaproteobacteria bacterium]|nr:CoA transferase [Deltaproteobacteria bacterium]